MTTLLRPAGWLLCAALISAGALAFVHILQSQGYIPCELCLRQREVYWTALAIALAGLPPPLLRRRISSERSPVFATFTRIACVALGVCFLVGAGVAAYHAGVEWKWWPGPTSCTVSGAKTAVGAAQVADIFSGKGIAEPPSVAPTPPALSSPASATATNRHH